MADEAWGTKKTLIGSSSHRRHVAVEETIDPDEFVLLT